MKIIHVDTNKYARYEMERDVPRIIPEAELHCFDHPDTTLAFVAEQGCDVLLTEIELWSERLGGIQLAEAIQKINPRVNIIFVTVWNENEVACELSGLPVRGFIQKPWKPEELSVLGKCPIQ